MFRRYGSEMDGRSGVRAASRDLGAGDLLEKLFENPARRQNERNAAVAGPDAAEFINRSTRPVNAFAR